MNYFIALLIVVSALFSPALAASHSNPHPGWTCHCDSAGNPHVHKGKSGR